MTAFSQISNFLGYSKTTSASFKTSKYLLSSDFKAFWGVKTFIGFAQNNYFYRLSSALVGPHCHSAKTSFMDGPEKI